jgi:hypothetical protein
MSKVYVGIRNTNGSMLVSEAREYQTSAFNAFMNTINNQAMMEMSFKYPNDINFKIGRFNSTGLSLYYSRFCEFHNNREEKSILSDNKKMLRVYAARHTRMSQPLTIVNGKKEVEKKKENWKINQL